MGWSRNGGGSPIDSTASSTATELRRHRREPNQGRETSAGRGASQLTERNEFREPIIRDVAHGSTLPPRPEPRQVVTDVYTENRGFVRHEGATSVNRLRNAPKL